MKTDQAIAINAASLALTHQRQARANQNGFSLIESLVAILLLSFGILGTMGLQAAALQSNRDAQQLSIALALAGELADQMRGNRTQAADTSTNNPYLGSFAVGNLTPTASSNCLNLDAGTQCSSNVELAQAHMTEWLARADAQLPDARVAICRNAAPYNSSGRPVWPSSCASSGSGLIFIQIGWSLRSTNTSSQRTNTSDPQWLHATFPSVVVPVQIN